MNRPPDSASADLQQTRANLQRQLAEARAERDENEAQKGALAEVLVVINSSLDDLASVVRRGPRMKRLVAAFALWLCVAVPTLAQKTDNRPIVGILRMNAADNVEPSATGLKDALAALGLVDGRNIRLELRYAGGHTERLPELAQSLVRAKASVILAFSAPAIRAAQRATSTIPIIANGELLASGLIASLARPGGNTTGVSMLRRRSCPRDDASPC
jgi:ABC transporter substrate binding protein